MCLSSDAGEGCRVGGYSPGVRGSGVTAAAVVVAAAGVAVVVDDAVAVVGGDGDDLKLALVHS